MAEQNIVIQKNDKQIYINYTSVYEKVNLLKNFINQDIIQESHKSFSNISELIAEMNGETCETLKLTSKLAVQKTEVLSNIFLNLLDFIEYSSKEFEREDLERANDIMNKEK